MWRMCFYESKTVFPTNWHIFILETASFLIHLQLAALKCLFPVFILVCSCGLWFANNDLNVLPLKVLPCLMDAFMVLSMKLETFSNVNILSITVLFYSCVYIPEKFSHWYLREAVQKDFLHSIVASGGIGGNLGGNLSEAMVNVDGKHLTSRSAVRGKSLKAHRAACVDLRIIVLRNK